jgi:hypothetical protein
MHIYIYILLALLAVPLAVLLLEIEVFHVPGAAVGMPELFQCPFESSFEAWLKNINQKKKIH